MEMSTVGLTMMVVNPEDHLGYNTALHITVSVSLCHISVFNDLLNVTSIQS